MKQWTVHLRGNQIVSATQTDSHGAVIRETGPLLTLKEFCRKAGKSRRQIYRDIQARRVRPLAKFLDTWLVEPAEFARLNAPPDSIDSLLPEYDRKTLDLDQNAELLLSRILKFGGGERLKWAFSFYGEKQIKKFVDERGQNLLDPKSYRYWRLHFGLKLKEPSLRTRKGRLWGGAG